jgi:hypothetical protein
MLQEAIVDGLLQLKCVSKAEIIQASMFEFDTARDRVYAFVPRQKHSLHVPASDELVEFFREAIEEGLRYHGFCDVIHIEA